MAVKLPTRSDLQKYLPKHRDVLRQITGRRIREPIPASKKKEALRKAKGKCQWVRCSERDILDLHHLNLRNDDNRLSNIKVLCPTHHRKIHQQIKRKIERDIVGREIKSRLVKVKPKTKKKVKRKKTRRKTNSILYPSLKWGI